MQHSAYNLVYHNLERVIAMKTNFWEKRLGDVGQETGEGLRRLREDGRVRQAVRALVCFLAGLILSQGLIFDARAPFGLSVVAAAGSGVFGLLSLLGASLGYFFLPRGLAGLQYIAAAILCYAAAFVFRDAAVSRKRWFAPVRAGGSMLLVGFIFLADQGFQLVNITLYLTESVLALGGAYFYGLLLHPLRESKTTRSVSTARVVALLATLGTLLLPMTRVTFLASISLGRIAAVGIVLFAAYYGGMGAGSATGVLAGATMDAVLGTPYYVLVYGLSGLISGGVSGLGRLLGAGSYVCLNALFLLLAGGASMPMSGLYEAFIASVIFLIIPESAVKAMQGNFLGEEVEEPHHATAMRQEVTGRLKGISRGFQELYKQVTAVFEKVGTKETVPKTDLYRAPVERVCRHCALRGLCWDQDAQTTYNVLNDVRSPMLERGKLKKTDFPAYFTNRCLNLDKFIEVTNEELTASRYRRQFGVRLEESRDLVRQQYGEMAQLLDGVANEVRQEMEFLPELEEKVNRFLRFKGVRGDSVVYRGRGGRLNVRLHSKDLSGLLENREDTRRELGNLLGVTLNQPEQQNCPEEERLLFREGEAFRADVQVAAQKKRGESVSGDSGTYFKGEDGELYVLLSDGMGSGREAAVESGMAVRLLERFLRAGVDPVSAVKLLNSSLMLKNGDGLSFVTVDLVRADLFTGEAELYKCGAAPSYLCRGRKVRRVVSTTLPVGTGTHAGPDVDVVKLKLASGDRLVLASDGILGGEERDWVWELLSREQAQEADLSQRVLAEAGKRHQEADDMTVVTIGFTRRGRQEQPAKRA